jgi:hypothetical protein
MDGIDSLVGPYHPLGLQCRLMHAFDDILLWKYADLFSTIQDSKIFKYLIHSVVLCIETCSMYREIAESHILFTRIISL